MCKLTCQANLLTACKTSILFLFGILISIVVLITCSCTFFWDWFLYNCKITKVLHYMIMTIFFFFIFISKKDDKNLHLQTDYELKLLVVLCYVQRRHVLVLSIVMMRQCFDYYFVVVAVVVLNYLQYLDLACMNY